MMIDDNPILIQFLGWKATLYFLRTPLYFGKLTYLDNSNLAILLSSDYS